MVPVETVPVQLLEASLDVRIPDESAALAQLARLMVKSHVIDRVEASPAGSEYARFYTHDVDLAEAWLLRNGYSVVPRAAH